MTLRRKTWQHNTLAGYDVCGGGGRNACDECRAARARATKRSRLLGPANPNLLVPADRARQAIEILRGRGLSDVAISRLTGMSSSNVERIAGGVARSIRKDTHDRIVAAIRYQGSHPLAGLRPGSLVSAARAHQQMRSLAALGWSLAWQRQQLGIRTRYPARSPDLQIRVELARQIQDLYDRYSGTRGPSRAAATAASRAGWHVPLAYDDDGQLIPDAIPNDLTRAAERREDRDLREELVARMTAENKSAAEIAAVLGVSDRTVTRARRKETA